MENKIAIIDMGTNTFHLLIAEADKKGYHITHRDRLAVKIGKGGINQGLITEEGIQRALLAMQSFKNTLDQQGIKRIYAFGTSALRNAPTRGRSRGAAAGCARAASPDAAAQSASDSMAA